MSIQGGLLNLWAGESTFPEPIEVAADQVNVTIQGQGAATVLVRGADMPAGKGLINVYGKNVIIRDLVIEGATTTPVGKLYGTMGSPSDDPMYADLVLNTSIWIHPGARNVRIENVEIRHTGGYAVLIDAVADDVIGVVIEKCRLINNRPHLFGTSSGDLNYGSWTGGIHWQGNGSTHAVRDLAIRGCKFERNTGNCCWGHAYGFGKLHSDIEVSDCSFLDCGLDGIMIGAQTGGAVHDCRFRRVGYVCTDDTSASVPKWLAGRYAVALDTAGLVRGVNYSGNTFMSCNGACMDLDGYCQGTVSGNTGIVPAVGEPEYTEDSIASFGPGGVGANWTYGCQPSNTNNIALPGTDITISGNTFINMGGGAVRLFAARNCMVKGNTILHPAAANYPPIAMGNTGTGGYQRSTGNVVLENRIDYNPSSEMPAVFEDSTYGAFSGTDKNWVAGNRLTGNCYEFKKDANSGSSTAVVMSSVANALATKSEMVTQREGVGTTAVTRGYQNLVGGATALYSMFDVLSNGSTAVGGPLWNVSRNGVGGACSTAGRTTAQWDDAVLTGKVWGDAFLAVTDTTYVAGDANLLPASVGLIRYDSSAHAFMQSVAVSAGARVWTPLGPTVAGSNTQIQYNNSGAFGASSKLIWNDASGILGLTGYVQASVGYTTTSTATDAIQATGGGVTVKWLIGTVSLTLSTTTAGTAGALAGRMYFDGSHFYACEDGTNWLRITGAAAVAGSNTQIQYNNSGAFGASSKLIWNDASGILGLTGYVQASAGYTTTSTATDAIQATGGGVTVKWLIGTVSLTLSTTTAGTAGALAGRMYFDGSHFYACEDGTNWLRITGAAAVAGSNTQIQYNNSGAFGASSKLIWNDASGILGLTGYVQASAGYTTTSTATDAIQATGGGVTVKWLIGTVSLTLSTTTAGTAGALAGRMYFDGSHFYACEDGTNWLRITSIAGVSSVAAGTGISVSASTGAVTISNTGVTSVGGYTGTVALYGGTGISVSGTTVSNTGVTAVYAGTGISVNANTGGLTVTNLGVTSIGGYTGACSLGGGTGVSISGLTISIGQAVATSSAVSFASVAASGAFSSSASGASYTFCNANSTFIVNGSGALTCSGTISTSGGVNVTSISNYNSIQTTGGMSAAQGFYVGSANVINSSGVFVGSNGINVGSAGISCGGYAFNGGYYGATTTFRDADGVTHQVRGGIITVS